MPEPFCLAMVLADAVHRDAATGKFTILGTFSTIEAAEFPTTVQVTVYFAVTDGIGKIPLRLKIVDSSSGLTDASEASEIFCSPPQEMDFSDPLVVVEAVAMIQTELPKPGLYHCELFAGELLLMSRRVMAVARGGRGNQESPSE